MKDQFVVGVFGQQGCGKSTLLNSLLGEEKYKTGVELDVQNFAQNQIKHLQTGHFLGDKNLSKLTTMDTPGFMDDVEKIKSTGILLNCFQQFVKDMVVRGLNSFLLVVSIKDFENMDMTFIKEVGLVFGNEFWDHLIVVVTHCDGDNWEDLKDDLMSNLKKNVSEVKTKIQDFLQAENSKEKVNEKFPPVIFMSNLVENDVKKVYDAIKDMPKYESETMKQIHKMLEDEKVKDEDIDGFILTKMFGKPDIDLSKICNIL
eukprot:gene11115-3934_t